MNLQLLPTTFNESGCATQQQHSCCLVIDDRVAIDAGSLATAGSERQRNGIRDVILTHAHLDHVAGLPLFIDDLFAFLEEPVCVHATGEVIDAVEKHIFNWVIYPDFTELKNEYGDVLVYNRFNVEQKIDVAHLTVKAVPVNHKVPSVGVLFSDGVVNVAYTGDSAEMDRFWEVVNAQSRLDLLLIECAFPDNLSDLAHSSHHLTPRALLAELGKFKHDCPVYAMNLKPMYREQIVRELAELAIPNLGILEVGRIYTI